MSRVNELTTTFLDALAMLGLGVGTGWAIAERYGVGVGIAWAALVIALLSAWAQRRAVPKPPKREATPAERPLPGPSHPGPVHIAGGR